RTPGYAGRTTQGSAELDVAWAPDGKSLVFVASRDRDRAAYDFTHTDLYQVALEGGEPRRLTGTQADERRGSWSEPRFSPDGRTLYALWTPRGDRVYNAARLGSLDWPSATPRAPIELPAARAVLSYAIAPNNRDLFMLAEDAGHVKVWRGHRNGRTASLAFDMDAGMYDNLVVAERAGRPVLIARFESSVNPPEIVRIEPERGGHRRLTDFSVQRAAALDLARPEHFWFETKRGTRIHNMLIRPPNFDGGRKYPLLVLMHGGPHTMWRDTFFLRWNYHLLAAPGYVVLLTNYTGSTGFGEAFAQAIQGDPLAGPAEEINQAADEAVARFAFI